MAKQAPEFVTYQLNIRISQPVTIVIGRLGTYHFPAGNFVYTGSAKRNMEARVARHLRAEKTLRWHIDYLLCAPGVSVTGVERSAQPECEVNQGTAGSMPVAGFGAGDCMGGCGSHLKFTGY